MFVYVGGRVWGATHLIHSWLTTGLFSDITGRDKAIDKVNIFVNSYFAELEYFFL